MGIIAKVMKYELTYLEGFKDFHTMQENVWMLQKQTREILNKTIREAYDWDCRSIENHEETGEYLDAKKETGRTLAGHIHFLLRQKYDNFDSTNLSSTIQKAIKKYNSANKDIFTGTISLPSYKSNQPIIIHNRNVRFYSDGTLALALFSKKFKQNYSDICCKNPVFKIYSCDNTQKVILQKIFNGEYTHGECQLVYENKKWFLILIYKFEAKKHELDENKILGVDLGEKYAIYASSVYEHGDFKIEGGVITAYAQRLEKRKRSLQEQAKYCGDGRIGHGTKTRVASVYKQGDKIANYRSTINHRFSKDLVNYAVKNGYGTIQMEDLMGIKADTGFPKRLQHWTYYDLQTKIESKAKEHGIKVVKINPQYTSIRCSKCGNIDSENRKVQEHFRCTACCFECNADFNASQNISIKDFEKIIGAKHK